MASDTKERILDVAEALFADKGFGATSLRDITAEAGVNLAAVNYHFGSKDALLVAVTERRLAPVNRQRLDMLDQVEARAGGSAPDLDDLLRALLAPPFFQHREWGDRGARFMQLIGRIHYDTPDHLRATLLEQFGEVRRRFVPAFLRALPDLSEDEATLRVHFIVGAMSFTMIWGQAVTAFGIRLEHPDEVLEALVQFAAAGLRAPAPVPARVRKGVVA